MTRCLWCANEADRLCDAAIGGRAEAGMGGRWVFHGDVFTCDAPMCAQHSKVIGHTCGKDGDFIERCPSCAENEPRIQPMFEHEAAAWRTQRAALVRRAQMRAIPLNGADDVAIS